MEHIRHLDKIPFFTPKLHGNPRVRLKNVIDRVTGSQNLSIIYAENQPGTLMDWHSHPFEQTFFGLGGELLLEIEGDKYRVGANTAVSIPAGTRHRHQVVSDEPWRCLEIAVPPTPAFEDYPH